MDLRESLIELESRCINRSIILDILNEASPIDEDEAKWIALAIHTEAEHLEMEEDLSPCEYCDGSLRYLVLTDSERDDRVEEALEQLLDDCVEGANNPYFDREKWKQDALMDGAETLLASYDGEEYEEEVDGELYFIYRLN
jgi:hypothetical protein